MTQPRIFALHGLLRIDQALLERGDGPQIAADGNDAAAGTDLQRGIADGNVGAALGRMIDLAPAERRLVGGIAQQLIDLGPAFDGDSVDPSACPTQSSQSSWARSVAAEGHIADDALGVDDQSNIRRCRYELSGNFGIEITERSLRGPEHVPCFSSEHCGGPCQAWFRLWSVHLAQHICTEQA